MSSAPSKRWFLLLWLAALLPAALTPALSNAQTPPPLDALLRGNPSVTSFTAALDAEGLQRMLQSAGPYTVLAPLNTGWTAEAGRRQTLLYHIIPGRFTADALAQRGSLNTALGQMVTASAQNGQVVLNGSARIITRDLAASNGILHLIDRPLTPSGAWSPAPQPTAPAAGAPPAAPQPPAAPPATGNPGRSTWTPTTGGATVIDVTTQVAQAGVQRFGVNLGQYNTNAAGFLLKNIIPNPGFEAAEFGMIFISTASASATRAQARSDFWQTRWNNEELFIGQPTGFWNGARYEVLSGPAAGRSGTITNFTLEDGLSTFYLSGSGAAPADAAIAVHRVVPGFQSNRWPHLVATPGDVRPGSPGGQSLRILPRPNGQPAFTRELDKATRDTDPSAGKLLQIDGPWTLSIWVKAATPNGQLRVRFSREGGNTFFDETIRPTAAWQNITRSFTGNDPLTPGQFNGPVRLDLWAIGGDVLVDDVSVQRAGQTNPTPFGDRTVEALRELRPGVLRFWASQLGSSLDNQLAVEFARKPTGFGPAFRTGLFYTYSLHDFMRLAQLVGAEPWIVIPPTYSPAEAQNLIAWLAAPAGSHPYAARRAALGQSTPWTSVFRQIHIEYGNEVWGGNNGADPFLGASAGGGVRAAQAADGRFGVMRSSPFFDDARFNLIANGQARFAGRQRELVSNGRHFETLALGPYYGFLERFDNDAVRFNPLYAHAMEATVRGPIAESAGILRQAGKQLAIYEINLHMVDFPATPQAIRNDVLTSQGAAVSLPLVMLRYLQEFGVRTQAVYELVEFSTEINKTNARLFGILRDIEATGRRRPTFYALAAVNRIVGGDMLAVRSQGPFFTQTPVNGVLANTDVPYVQAYAFREGNRYGVALFNLDIAAARPVTLNVPAAGARATLTELVAPLYADNEDRQAVALQTRGIAFGRSTTLTLPPHSLTVIEWTP